MARQQSEPEQIACALMVYPYGGIYNEIANEWAKRVATDPAYAEHLDDAQATAIMEEASGATDPDSWYERGRARAIARLATAVVDVRQGEYPTGGVNLSQSEEGIWSPQRGFNLAGSVLQCLQDMANLEATATLAMSPEAQDERQAVKDLQHMPAWQIRRG